MFSELYKLKITTVPALRIYAILTVQKLNTRNTH